MQAPDDQKDHVCILGNSLVPTNQDAGSPIAGASKMLPGSQYPVKDGRKDPPMGHPQKMGCQWDHKELPVGSSLLLTTDVQPLACASTWGALCTLITTTQASQIEVLFLGELISRDYRLNRSCAHGP